MKMNNQQSDSANSGLSNPLPRSRWARLRWRIALVIATLAAGFAGANDYFDPEKPHHTQDGFKNNYLQGDIGGSFIKWQWQRITQGLPKPPANNYQFPVVKPDAAWLAANKSETTVTWIGHATALVQTHGVNILTDPLWSERASPFSFIGPKRKVPVPIALADLPHIDVVVISHNHYDHLDRDTVLKLNQQAGGAPLFLVPLGIKKWMNNVGITNVQELDWWNKTSAHNIDFTFLPVQHWSARGLNDRFETLWGGWAIVTQTAAPADASNSKPFSLFFAGDTAYSKDFADIGQRFGGFDVALVPIGAYEPRWFMKNQHVDPSESVKIHQDIHAKKSIAIHWGTFELTDEPLDAPPKMLSAELKKAEIADDQFVVLKHGETVRF